MTIKRKDTMIDRTHSVRDCCECGASPSPCDALDRRRFIAKSALAAAALALAGCMNDPFAPKSVSGSIKISDYPDLTEVNGVALITINGASLAVVRTGDASFVALSRVCPHRGGSILPVDGGFICTAHGALFDTTGVWAGGQRTSNMYSIPTEYDAATGTLTIG